VGVCGGALRTHGVHTTITLSHTVSPPSSARAHCWEKPCRQPAATRASKLPFLTPWLSLQVITPLLRILEKMDALHLLHRDIKPENIFLTGACAGHVTLLLRPFPAPGQRTSPP
jgi:hypothetical protein